MLPASARKACAAQAWGRAQARGARRETAVHSGSPAGPPQAQPALEKKAEVRRDVAGRRAPFLWRGLRVRPPCLCLEAPEGEGEAAQRRRKPERREDGKRSGLVGSVGGDANDRHCKNIQVTRRCGTRQNMLHARCLAGPLGTVVYSRQLGEAPRILSHVLGLRMGQPGRREWGQTGNQTKQQQPQGPKVPRKQTEILSSPE